MIEDERGHETAALLCGEQIESPQHLGILVAIQRREQGLERAHVEGRQRPCIVEATFFELGAKQIEIRFLHGDRDDRPCSTDHRDSGAKGALTPEGKQRLLAHFRSGHRVRQADR